MFAAPRPKETPKRGGSSPSQISRAPTPSRPPPRVWGVPGSRWWMGESLTDGDTASRCRDGRLLHHHRADRVYLSFWASKATSLPATTADLAPSARRGGWGRSHARHDTQPVLRQQMTQACGRVYRGVCAAVLACSAGSQTWGFEALRGRRDGNTSQTLLTPDLQHLSYQSSTTHSNALTHISHLTSIDLASRTNCQKTASTKHC